MDEFGILTQNFGLKPQGKSAPMAASKVNSNLVAPNSGLGNSNFPPNSSRTANGHDGYFPSTGSVKPQKSNDLEDYNDLFGGPIRFSKRSDDRGSGSAFDYDSIFGGPSDSGSKSSSLPDYDDGIFGSVPGLKSSASVNDLFVSTASPPKFSQQFDDLLGNFNESGLQSNGANGKSYGEVGKNADGFDDLIPGFGGSNGAKNGSKTSPDAVKSSVLSSIDELEDFAMGKVRRSASERQETGEADAENSANEHTFRVKEKKKREWRRPEKESQTAHEETTAAQENQHVDDNDIEPFFSMDAQPSRTSRPGNTASERETARDEVPAQQVDENDIESFFSMNARASTVPGPRFTAPDIMFDELSKDTEGPAVTQSSSAGTSSNTRKDSPSVNFVDDFSFMFGVGAAVGDFQEIDGEIEERRAARWKRHQETKERMAKAVADMNQRDFQTQQEQEKRHRIAETVNTEIKQWSAGKEGNLRALLSSLQCVLWPECGWQPVPLTDLITSTSVKKVYKKATLCVHPDKVQQKGANTHQKYVSEKVFDILKEAWTKFNSEEFR